MSGSVFPSYGASYFDLLSQRIDDNEAEITDVAFAKLTRPDPIIPNGLLYVSDFDGNTKSSTILCQSNNALQSVKCVQLKTSTVNPATQIPELSGQDASTVWLSSANGHLYRGAVDLETTGSGDISGPSSSSSNSIAIFNGITGKVIKESSISALGSSLTYPTISGTTDLLIVGNSIFSYNPIEPFIKLGNRLNPTSETNAIIMGNGIGGNSFQGDKHIILGNNSCVSANNKNSLICLGSGSMVSAFGNDTICLGHDSLSRAGTKQIIVGDNTYNSSGISGANVVMLGHNIMSNSGGNGTNSVVVGNDTISVGGSSSSVIVGSNTLPIATGFSNGSTIIGRGNFPSVTNGISASVIIGNGLGVGMTSGCSSCLWIDAEGVSNEVNTLRLGTLKTSCYISGIYSAIAASSTQKTVKMNSDGRLVASYEARPFGSHSISGSNLAAINVPTYTVATTNPSTGKIVMGVAPTSNFSSDGLFVSGLTVGSFRYTGGAALARITLSIGLTYSGTTSSLLNVYLLKNNVFVPNSLCAGTLFIGNTNSPSFMVSLVANDLLEIGFTTIGTGAGIISVYNENRFIEIVG